MSMNKTINKRDLNKQARRDAVMEAAERLIRDRGDVSFSMIELAKASGLSLATPYNLFGTKSAILYALLNLSADKIFASNSIQDGLSTGDRVLAAAGGLSNVLSSDPDFYRALYAFLMGVPDPTWRPAFIARSRLYWTAPLIHSAIDLLPIDNAIIADLLVVQALGCVEMWVHREIGDHQLDTELRRSCCAVLLGVYVGTDKERLLDNIRCTHLSPQSQRRNCEHHRRSASAPLSRRPPG